MIHGEMVRCRSSDANVVIVTYCYILKSMLLIMELNRFLFCLFFFFLFFVFVCFYFFFQAEDGIRDVAVTGVQTCALPICVVWLCRWFS